MKIEPQQVHLCAIEDDKTVVGVCVLVPPAAGGERIKMRQVAVAPTHQRQGIGGKVVEQFLSASSFSVVSHTLYLSLSLLLHCCNCQLMRAAAVEAKRRGHAVLYCHARATAQEFYAALGYATVSDRFEEVGIPHYRMELDLNNINENGASLPKDGDLDS